MGTAGLRIFNFEVADDPDLGRIMKPGHTLCRTYVKLKQTMLLGELWHCASWNFAIWGGLHGVALAAHK